MRENELLKFKKNEIKNKSKIKTEIQLTSYGQRVLRPTIVVSSHGI